MIPYFFFNDTAPTEIYTLSLHDALPICGISTLSQSPMLGFHKQMDNRIKLLEAKHWGDRKSGSAGMPRPISYAVFCLKKKKKPAPHSTPPSTGSSTRQHPPLLPPRYTDN